MSNLQDKRLEPSDISPEIVQQIESLVRGGKASLTGPSGERIELPPALYDLLAYVVDSINHKRAIVMLHEDEAFTTQAAANFLGMSRPYLLRLLEAGQIPFHRVGTHRRIVFKDLLNYQKARSKERNEGLDKLTELLESKGYYDRKLEPEV